MSRREQVAQHTSIADRVELWDCSGMNSLCKTARVDKRTKIIV